MNNSKIIYFIDVNLINLFLFSLQNEEIIIMFISCKKNEKKKK